MDGQTIDYSEAVTGLRIRLDAAMRMVLDHMPHGCEMVTAMQGAAFAYADLLHDIGAGPDPQSASIAEIMIAHGIPGPWDYMPRRDGAAPAAETVTVDAVTAITGADAVEILATFTGDLDAVEGIGPDGMPVYPWPTGPDGVAGEPPSF